jgi:hypothetical protein
MADALNLESLLEHLTDFLLNGGFAGGRTTIPTGDGPGTEDTNSLDALKRALLKALMRAASSRPR